MLCRLQAARNLRRCGQLVAEFPSWTRAISSLPQDPGFSYAPAFNVKNPVLDLLYAPSADGKNPNRVVEPTIDNLKRVDRAQRSRMQEMNSRNIDDNDRLKMELVKEMPYPLSQLYPYLYFNEWQCDHHEWKCQLGFSLAGKGDLVFAGPGGRFAIVETKFLNLVTSGPAAVKRREHQREKVWNHSLAYMLEFRHLLQTLEIECAGVTAFTFTNEQGLRNVSDSPRWSLFLQKYIPDTSHAMTCMHCKSTEPLFPELVAELPLPREIWKGFRCARCLESLATGSMHDALFTDSGIS